MINRKSNDDLIEFLKDVISTIKSILYSLSFEKVSPKFIYKIL